MEGIQIKDFRVKDLSVNENILLFSPPLVLLLFVCREFALLTYLFVYTFALFISVNTALEKK